MEAKPRVLLVDDEERFRTTLARMLTGEGLAVVALGSGREALKELQKQPFDVMLLDLRMPEMDGLTTLAEAKRLSPGTEVIILTGHASLDAAMDIIRLGGYDYLLKPCPLEDLLLKIEAAYEKKLAREKQAPKGAPVPGET